LTHPSGRKFNEEVGKHTQSEEYRKISDFSSVMDVWDFSQIWRHWKQRYPLTILLATPFFICMLVRRGLNPLVELFLPLQFAGAVICWPVAAFFYPTSDPAKQVQKAVRCLGYALSFLISLGCANLAKAQTKNLDEAGWEQHSELQVDASVPPLPINAPPPRVQVQVNLYVDGHEAQSWLFLNFKRWSIYQQNRRSTDGASPFSYLGIGPRFSVGKVATTVWVGPQYTYKTGKWDKTLVYSAFTFKRAKWSLLSANKLAFSNNEKSPFADRHVQNIHAPPMPSWLSFQGEELHVPAAKKPWQEMEFGPMASIGGLFRLRWLFLKDCYVYPFRDLARGEWDARVGYAHTFGK